MKSRGDRSREYRVLAIAVAFFAVGLFLFWRDSAIEQPGSSTAATSASGGVPNVENAQVQPAATGLEPSLAKFPAPSEFQGFYYNATGINGLASLSITATCHDSYLTILIFSKAFDYRSDISKAVYNKAFACAPNQTFHTILSKVDIANIPFGNYYVIIADQGISGAWYNPR